MRHFEETEILYEISLATGTSLDLATMLRDAVSTILRTLSCSGADVLRANNHNGALTWETACLLPHALIKNRSHRDFIQNLKLPGDVHDLGGFLQTLPASFNQADFNRVVFDLPDFGVLILEKTGQPLDYELCRSLQVLMKKLASAALACLNKTELESHRQYLASVIETQHEMVCRFLPDTTLTFVNAAYCRRMNLAAADLIGKKVLDLIPQAEQNNLLQRIAGLNVEKPSCGYSLEKKTQPGITSWQRWVDHAIFDYSNRIVEIQSSGYDISELKRQQSALEKSEARLSSILNNMNDVIWSATWPDLKIQFITPSAEKLFGQSIESFINTPAFWKQLIIENDHEVLENFVPTLLKSGEWEREYRISRPDTTIVWVRHHCRLIYDKNDNPVRLNSNITNISLRKRAEEELLKRTAELEGYFTSSLDMLCIADNQGRFRRLNPEWKTSLGYDISELEGRQFLDLVHPDDVQSTIAAMQNLQGGSDVTNFINRYRRVDGTYRWIEWRSRPIDNLVYAVARDITLAKTLEQQLSRHDAIETLMAGIATLFINLKPHETDARINESLGKVGQLLEVDRVYIFAFSADLSTSSNTYEWCSEGTEPQIANLQDVPSELLPWWMDKILNHQPIVLPSLAMLPPEANGERGILEPQGIKSLLALPLSYQGKIQGFIGFDSVAKSKDWTSEDVAPLEFLSSILVNAQKRKENEITLRELNATLEQRVAERTDELQKIQTKLFMQDKMVSIGQLAAGLAHEINNPVGFVSTNFATLKENFAAIEEMLTTYRDCATSMADNPELKGKIETIRNRENELMLDFIMKDIPNLFAESQDGFKRITEIIKSMRTFARHDALQAFSSYNINEGIRETLTIAKNAYRHVAELQLRTGEIPDITAVPGQVNQVLLNIILNSTQALETKFGSTGNGIIKITTWPEESCVVCEISDNGPGIPEKFLRRIFDPFFTTKAPGKGTGLGLSISYDIIVNKHGGLLNACNLTGGGACFRITLPLTQPASEGNNG